LRALIRSWCRQTSGPRRLDRPPLIEASSGGSVFSGLSLDLRLAFRLLRREPGFAVVLLVAFVACAIPARRAARIDAIDALRH
jgi:ABC-type lipoprotein release transport system permease subunit